MVSNGRLDVNALTKVPLSAGGFGYLENSTAQGWFAAREDLIRTTGITPFIINDGLYRDYARQVYWKTYWTRLGKPENAATPGTSNHGLGLAVDINNISAYNQKTLDAVMARHGFVRDTTETWHYHHTSTNPADNGSTPILPEPSIKEDDDMPKNYRSGGTVFTLGESFGKIWTNPNDFSYLTNIALSPLVDVNMTPDQIQTAVNEANSRGAAYSASGAAPVINVQELANAIVSKLPNVTSGISKQDVIDAIKSVSYKAQ